MMYTCPPHRADSSHGRDDPERRSSAAMRGAASTVKTVKTAKTVKTMKTVKTVKGRRGRSVRVDIHCHYFNPVVAEQAAPLNPAQHEPSILYATPLTREVNVKQMKDRAAQLSTIEVRLKDMNRMGIDIQAVSPAPPQFYYWTDPSVGAELAAKINDRIAEIVSTWPDRFVGLGTVPLQNADLAVAELERAVKTLGLRGLEINTNVNGLNLTDPSLGLEKFFRRVQELDVVLFLHPNSFTHADRLTHHYFNNVIGNPLDSTIAVSHLIFDGVLERNPKLKLVVAHSGGYLAHYWARMDHAHRARPDCRTVIRKAPSSYLKKFHFDTITFDTDMLRHSIDKWGADHILLGTDYPYDMGDTDPVSHIERVPRLARADKDLIMGGNAARLLKIKQRKI